MWWFSFPDPGGCPPAASTVLLNVCDWSSGPATWRGLASLLFPAVGHTHLAAFSSGGIWNGLWWAFRNAAGPFASFLHDDLHDGHGSLFGDSVLRQRRLDTRRGGPAPHTVEPHAVHGATEELFLPLRSQTAQLTEGVFQETLLSFSRPARVLPGLLISGIHVSENLHHGFTSTKLVMFCWRLFIDPKMNSWVKCGVNVANGTRKGWFNFAEVPDYRLGHGVSGLAKVVLFSSCKKLPSLKGLLFHVCKLLWGIITIVNFILKGPFIFFTFIFPLSKHHISCFDLYLWSIFCNITTLGETGKYLWLWNIQKWMDFGFLSFDKIYFYYY